MKNNGLTAHEQYLLTCPGMEKQRTCCVCGNFRESMHHVVPRSRGGHNGPQLPLCGSGTTGCHGKAHDEGAMRLTFSWHGDWSWTLHLADDFAEFGKCRTDDEWELLDTTPTDSAELMADEEDKLRELLEMGGKVDYLIGVELASADKRMGRKELAEWLCDTFGFKPKSVGSYISKRIAYGRLEGHGVESLGITNGYRVAQIVEQGHSLADVMRDYHSMPREQFDEKYKGAKRPKKPKPCPRGGFCEV